MATQSLILMIAKAIGVVCLGYILKFFVNTYLWRKHVRNLNRKYGIDVAPHSWFWGHLLLVNSVIEGFPPDAGSQLMPRLLMDKYPHLTKHGFIYLDMWPAFYPMLCIFDPDLLSQTCQEPSLRKHQYIRDEFRLFTGNRDILTLDDGPEWKRWRAAFNPGFSARNIVSLVPAFLEEAEVFRDQLRNIAKSGQAVPLLSYTIKGTCDIICRAVLGTRIHCQTTQSPFYEALRNQVAWLISAWDLDNLLKAANPYRFYAMRRNNRIMRDEVVGQLERQVRASLQESASRSSSSTPATSYKTINTLAIQSCLKQTSAKDIIKDDKLDSDFVDTILAQLQIFMLAGHDTTASALCYLYNHIHTTPGVRDKMVAEHNAVFGDQVEEFSHRVKENPSLLNSLTYTSACIKETLRLYPPVGSIRQGGANDFLVHPRTKLQLPVEGWMIFAASQCMHRNPDFWPDEHSFIPERWLVPEGDPLRPKPNTWRPFELGPRNCIGQELAQTELRLILALTVREFQVVPAYPENAPRIWGELAYQTSPKDQVTNFPVAGLPVTVRPVRGS